MKRKRYSINILTVMKLSFLQFVLATAFSLSLFAKVPVVKAQTVLDKKITISVQKEKIIQVLSQITRQTGVKFAYSSDVISLNKKITCDFQKKPLIDFFTQTLDLLKIDYKVISSTQILLMPIPKSEQKTVPGDNIVISGQITNNKDRPLAGASVVVKGTLNGAVTDANGRYSLSVSGKGDTLVFSFVGYKEQDIVVGDETVINVQLSSDNSQLDQVIVVGYGTRSRGTVTGAISTVDSTVFENRPLNNVYDALQGAIPGVTITRGSGQPGNQLYTLQIRGYSSINGNQPLVLIDGIPGDINSINPSDILKVSVLKDAAAAIYGNRAADGVILITTKKGKEGTPVVDYTVNVGLKVPHYLKKMMNTLEYAKFQSEGLINAGIQGFPQSVFDSITAGASPDLTRGWNYGITNYPGFYGYTDWNKVIYKSSNQQIHNLSVSGGSKNSTYHVSAGFDNDNGNLNYGTNYSNRYNLRVNYGFRVLKNFNIQMNTSFENDITKTPTMIVNALTNVVRQFPYQPVYNPEGEFYGYQGYENPAQSLTQGGNGTTEYTRFNANFKADYTVLNGLTLTGQAGVHLDYEDDNNTSPTFTRYNWAGDVQDIRNNPNSASYNNNKTTYQLYQLYGDYSKQLGLSHHFDLTVGTSLEKTNNQGQSITGYNFPDNKIFTLNLADRTNVAYSNFSGYLNNEALSSYFGRFSYSFKSKFILDFTARADGSSKFSPSKRWSELFPSLGFAYNLSKEAFIQKLNIFDQLKLRLSWGKAGNQDISSLGLFDYVPLITISGNYPLGSPNAGVPGAVASPASTNRTWETVENKNIGLDIETFKSRLGFSFDYFNKINEDMLVAIAVPATFGGNPPSSNQGRLVTKGFETTISWKDHIRDFRYGISLQLSDNKDKLVQLKNSDSYREGLNFTRQGYPIYSYFGYVYNGIIKTQSQLDNYKKLQGVPNDIAIGDVMYKDVDGDGKLTEYGDKTKGLSGDMVYLGSLVPRYTYSSNISLGYKQFNLQVFIQGVGKRMIAYQGNIATPNTFYWPTLEYYYNKTWSPSNNNAKYPRYVVGAAGYDDIRSYDYHTSSLTMQNAAYLRFKVISIGYDLPTSLINRLKVKSARVFLSGQDLFTISKGTLGGNFDPEDGNRDESTYPFNRVYSIGVDIKF